MKKKKILYLLSERDFGIGTLLLQQAIAFRKATKLDFLFVTGGTEKEIGLFRTLDEERISYVKIAGLEYHKQFFQLVKELKIVVENYKPEYIHVQTNWQLAIAITIKTLLFSKVKLLYTVHGFRNTNKYKSILFRTIISIIFIFFVKKIIVCSGYVKQSFSVLKSKTSLLFLGVDPSYLTKSLTIQKSGDDTIYLYYPALFRKGKNQDLLIRAYGRALRKVSTLQKMKLVLPGDGELKEYCQNLAKDMGISEYVDFPGFLNKEELLVVVRKSSIAVIPSSSETFGLCIAEPFAMGKCVISRRVGIATDIIMDKENGFLFDTEDELYEVFKSIFSDLSSIKKCRIKAYEDKYLFDWNKIAMQYQNILEEI